jgi:hypothetical protein
MNSVIFIGWGNIEWGRGRLELLILDFGSRIKMTEIPDTGFREGIGGETES